MPELFVFKPGNYKSAGNWPIERVQRFVDAYDPENNLEAPVVIGHRWLAMRDADQYAHGWVSKLRMDKDGKVYATIDEFSKEAKQAIEEKKLRYMSVELYNYDEANKDDPPYFRAIALLGRDSPAVLGTKIDMFSADGFSVTTDTEKHTTTFNRKISADEFSLAGEQNTQEEGMKTNEELEKALLESQSKAEAFQKELDTLRGASRKTEAETFFSQLRDAGKLPPALFARAVSMDMRLGDEDRKEFRALCSEMDAKVDLSGTHAVTKKDAPTASSLNASQTDKIKAFAKEHKLSFKDAAIALSMEQPEIFEEEGTDA
jgi:hypothetical protein